jgi:hypothetical protein
MVDHVTAKKVLKKIHHTVKIVLKKPIFYVTAVLFNLYCLFQFYYSSFYSEPVI